MKRMTEPSSPDRVARFQEVYAGPTRVTVMRLLLQHSRSYRELIELTQGEMSRPAVYKALDELVRVGYVEHDAPDSDHRKPSKTRFTARRDLIAEDLGATVAHLLG